MDILNTINSFVWGPPLMVLLIGTGILLTVRIALKPCVRRWQLLLVQVIS